ncbi:MAG: hypothetical protein FRX49_10265 [Trebouxia sp. A1-2]|nr:MAG: hypothetical protein FRX49_10265 [Trebouxia sp. A1-2]
MQAEQAVDCALQATSYHVRSKAGTHRHGQFCNAIEQHDQSGKEAVAGNLLTIIGADWVDFDVFFARLMVAFATKQGDRLRGNAVAVCTSKSVTSKVDCQQEQHSHKGSRATSMVAALRWLNSLRVRVIWKVVLLSRPVLISSRNKVFLGPTSNSPGAVVGGGAVSMNSLSGSPGGQQSSSEDAVQTRSYKRQHQGAYIQAQQLKDEVSHNGVALASPDLGLGEGINLPSASQSIEQR